MCVCVCVSVLVEGGPVVVKSQLDTRSFGLMVGLVPEPSVDMVMLIVFPLRPPQLVPEWKPYLMVIYRKASAYGAVGWLSDRSVLVDPLNYFLFQPVVKCLLIMRWVRSVPHGRPFELFLVLVCVPRLVLQRSWYVLSCLCK